MAKCQAAKHINSLLEFKLPGEITYVAPPSDFYNEDGLPCAAFYEADYIHINECGYEALFNSINSCMSLVEIAPPAPETDSTKKDCSLFELEYIGCGWNGDGEAKPQPAHNSSLSVSTPTPAPFPPLPRPAVIPPNPAPHSVLTKNEKAPPPPVARTKNAVFRQVKPSPTPLSATTTKNTCRPFLPFCRPPRDSFVTHSLSEQFRRKRPKPTPPAPYKHIPPTSCDPVSLSVLPNNVHLDSRQKCRQSKRIKLEKN